MKLKIIPKGLIKNKNKQKPYIGQYKKYALLFTFCIHKCLLNGRKYTMIIKIIYRVTLFHRNKNSYIGK